MRNPSLFAMAALAISATAFAQSPLTTTFAAGNGQNGNMFDIVALNPSGVTIDYFDVHVGTGTFDFEVYKLTTPGPYLPSVNTAADWTLVGSVTGVEGQGNGNPTQLPIPVCEFIPAGATQSFYVTTTNGGIMNYTNGSTTGVVFASNADLEFLEGAGVAYPFASNFNPRVFNGNIYYNVGNDPAACTSAFASKELFGTGCYESAASFYEVMDAASMDLGGVAVIGTNNGNGYDITTAPSSIAALGPGAVNTNLGDDASVDTATIGGTLGIHVGSNGWVALGGGNSTGFAPDVATMLSNPATGLYAWTDLQPLSGGGTNGDIWYEESGSVATITFDNVDGWNTGLPNTIQFTWDTATGDFVIAFGVVSTGNPEDWLIGYSQGGASVDGGPTDLSAGPFSVAATDGPALALDSSAPLLGSIWSLQLDNIDPASPFAVFGFGDAAIDPGFDLTPLGGPGCFLYMNGNLGFFIQPQMAGSSSINVLLPNISSLLGAFAAAQGAGFTSQNALTFATSNGLRVTVGN